VTAKSVGSTQICATLGHHLVIFTTKLKSI